MSGNSRNKRGRILRKKPFISFNRIGIFLLFPVYCRIHPSTSEEIITTATYNSNLDTLFFHFFKTIRQLVYTYMIKAVFHFRIVYRYIHDII